MEVKKFPLLGKAGNTVMYEFDLSLQILIRACTDTPNSY